MTITTHSFVYIVVRCIKVYNFGCFDVKFAQVVHYYLIKKSFNIYKKKTYLTTSKYVLSKSSSTQRHKLNQSYSPFSVAKKMFSD